jgi:hypothetical protein
MALVITVNLLFAPPPVAVVCVEIEIALNQQNGARDNRYNEARTSTFTHALKSMENIAFKKALKKAAEKAGSRRLADAIGELFVGFTPRDLENITPVDGYNMIAEELIEARMATSTNGSLSLKGHILIALTSIAFEFMVHHMLSEFERSQAAFEDYQFLKSKDWKVLGKLIQNKVITRKTGKTFMGSGGGKTPIFVYSNADIYNGVISKVVPTPYYIENEQQAMKLLGFVPTVVYIGFTEHYDSENNLFYYQNKVPFK